MRARCRLSPDEIEFLYSLLIDLGVEVIDEKRQELGGLLGGRRVPEAYLDVTIDHTADDPVRVYLREIGRSLC